MNTSVPNDGLQLRSLVRDSGEVELSLVRVPTPPPAADEVVVRVEATPINPSDIGMLFGAADLATVAVRVVRRKLRRRRLLSFIGFDAEPDYACIVVAPSQQQALLITRAYRVLDRLPIDEKIAWTLRHVEGEPLDAVARITGCSLATAKRRIAAAQATLDEEVGE